MAIKVGINGFGRIGRVVLRIMIEHPEQFDICGINLRKADLDYMVYMIKYDSVFRQFNGTVEHKDKNLIVNGHTIQVFSESDAAMIPWSSCGAEKQLVVQEALETTFMSEWSSMWFTPMTNVGVTSSLPGAVRMTFFAPPLKWRPPSRRRSTPAAAAIGARAAPFSTISSPPPRVPPRPSAASSPSSTAR